jgi:hypothetical protein
VSNKRRLNEVIALYELEPDLKDIYVEGDIDKLIIDRFLKKYGMNDVSVKTAEDIDFSVLYENSPEIKRNNKKNLLALGRCFQEGIIAEFEGATIILDRDFDDLLDVPDENKYILYTDYNSLELYLFDENVVDIFFTNYLTGFPFTAKETLHSITPILVEKFLIRLILSLKGSYPKDKITDLKKSVIVNKSTGKIAFDQGAHLFKILNNLGITAEKNDFSVLIEDFRNKLSSDNRKNIRGHDFTHLLFLFIDKIKNNIDLTEKAFEKAFFHCIDYSELRKENLFSSIEKRYMKRT